ncbi:glycogen debranching protein GlgX [Candidatus Methylospira mobilis]|uniref:Glycogen debranching protein GlgX n=1 Tax=Candidatus Methylospira mobilis TaxID=1808979 RepID=A0A5Q0BL21_9GAMM|nr:glycogen debranching protein GlgX [Candidatus Methylospira mobilis]QFY42466.1 glycogen debranching protein GlgX [Candidatus Methylospira mobilis]WNV04427.1 glycogen debranching protein GlgX [Candidatus Methylospira mobilis]
MPVQYSVSRGRRYPNGISTDQGGVNFSIFGWHATRAELLLYERADSPAPFQIILLNPDENKTFFSWHVYVEKLPSGTNYTWRLDGPRDTKTSGFRFNPDKELLDPWARAVTDHFWNRQAACEGGSDGPCSYRAMVVNEGYDWEGDVPLNHALEDTIIYEVHVRGFTRHASSNVANPGTYSAVIEKIPYLKSLGITDIELLPVMAFDEQDVPPGAARLGLKNYWGYSPHSFFSPHPGYCITPEQGTHRREFKDMVKALHQAGIGVILDVVFNHTAEGGVDGPTINMKGLGNAGFYHLDKFDRSRYRDFTGCGNTINANHPIVADFLHDILVYWVNEFHVDGFRFDLASALCRGMDGNPLRDPPVLWAIELSDTLAQSRIIAEAWDAAGLYQVGGFPGFRWREWNGRYRDVVRRFVRGDCGLIGELATRVSGNSDFYQHTGRLPTSSINFVTCHDGFTLYDLVSYNDKHNEANGEDNRDGTNDNYSWNCGYEGECEDTEILALRKRQAKNMLAILMLSQGVPMMRAGDEVLRTQKGNNNGYCQDNELSWFDWNLAERQANMLQFVQRLIAFRKRHPSLRRRRFMTGGILAGRGIADVTWHGAQLHAPQWDDPDSRLLAYTLAGRHDTEADLHIIFNLSHLPCKVELPIVPGRVWHRALDTALDTPDDIPEPARQVLWKQPDYPALPRSVVVMEGLIVSGQQDGRK